MKVTVALRNDPLLPYARLSMSEDTSDRSRLSDEELIRLVVAGDAEPFAELVLRHRGHVSRIIKGHVPASLIPEVAHDIFVKAYTALGTYAFERPFGHWLAVIAVRHCYDIWRRAARRKEVSLSGPTSRTFPDLETVLAVKSQTQYIEKLRQQEATTLVHWALGQLSPENRMVVTLVHLDGYKMREAADLLGWSVVNVKVRVHRARRQLRRIIDRLAERGT
jgi:RNA polymerase sigma-70 factor (ECF subfamily)